MSDLNPSDAMHKLDVTLWVGKHGVDAVADELADQLTDRELVKVKFLRAARADGDVEALATELTEQGGGSVVETRGHTAVIRG
ncbi:YhbY family RNA-binding protein [Halorhabdus salina]|uniref:YhbY family RNA-binding protein n=1 Tax=Halorhabdus salina TaxID=2750670 RepID=UPI0015EFCC07|nr:YhbY family RNA-binding protein [Halorhabdus salina]